MEFKKGITYLVSGEDTNLSLKDEPSAKKTKKNKVSLKRIPLLPVKGTVIFPYMTLPLRLNTPSTIQFVKKLHAQKKPLGIIAKKKDTPQPQEKDLYNVGTVTKILKIIHLADNEVVALLQGKERFSLQKVSHTKHQSHAHIKTLNIQPLNTKHKRTQVLLTSIKQAATEILSETPDVPSEVQMMINDIKYPDLLIYYIASTIVPFPVNQHILSLSTVLKQATLLLKNLLRNLEFLKIQKQIHQKVHNDINVQQRQMFLRQQIKVLQEELGEEAEDADEDIQELRTKAKNPLWPTDVQKHLLKTIKKAQKLHPGSAEYSLLLNYAHTFTEIPWGHYTSKKVDLKKAQSILNKHHYGIDKVKDKIITMLAVQELKDDNQGRILCLSGPPGVGKTSLCKSIAEALGREYVRVSLGGVHDEAELRGHRRTYVGAMMGQIMNAIKKAGTANPVILLDEIDKIDDARGNPSAALLEILDPKQNHHFTDNFLGIPFDLSKVIFIATANDTSSLSLPLYDRLEIISLPGYLLEEKITIAKKHLLPQARKDNGLKSTDLTLAGNAALEHLIENYTNEAGVRSLSRQIDLICSYAAKNIVLEEKYPKKVSKSHLQGILGPPKYDLTTYQEIEHPGVSVGLAWTSVGGEILFIETTLYKGEGKVTTSGQLGEIMQESASTALSYLKANAKKLDIQEKIFKQYDLHIHVPDGATPKDGPSAGIALLSAIASLYTQRKLLPNLAMTGEVTLQGKVLPVGGIKEKVLAAKRAHIKTILLSKRNEKDIQDIKPAYLEGLNLIYVDNAQQVLAQALHTETITKPAPWAKKTEKNTTHP